LDGVNSYIKLRHEDGQTAAKVPLKERGRLTYFDYWVPVHVEEHPPEDYALMGKGISEHRLSTWRYAEATRMALSGKLLDVMDLEPQAEEDVVAPSDNASVNLPPVRGMRSLWHRRLAHVGDAMYDNTVACVHGCRNELRTSPCVCAVRWLSLQSSGAHEMHGMLGQ
jgi:hypothetical protein